MDTTRAYTPIIVYRACRQFKLVAVVYVVDRPVFFNAPVSCVFAGVDYGGC